MDFGADYTSNNINNSIPAGSGLATGDYDFDGSSDDRAYIIPFGSEASVTSSSNWTTPAGKSGATINYGISVANIDSSTDPDVEFEPNHLGRRYSGDQRCGNIRHAHGIGLVLGEGQLRQRAGCRRATCPSPTLRRR